MEAENKLLKDDIETNKLITSFLKNTQSLERKMIKVSVIPLETTLYEMIKIMSQTSQRMADLKNYKLVLKIFILRLIYRK